MPPSDATLPATMHAWMIEDVGDSTVFERRRTDVPVLNDRQVLVRVRATSVNPVDYMIRRGDEEGLCPTRPATLHGDVSGTVVKVGNAVSEFGEGDAVYGCAGGFVGAPHGALADYMPCDARLLAPKPKSLSFREAAALPLVTLTAWEGLIDKADLQGDEHVLVHGGTGGVGHIGLQLAHWRGCRVAATASSKDKLDRAVALGADDRVNYETEPVSEYVDRCTGGRGFDLVFDTVAGKNIGRSMEATRFNGSVVTVGTGRDDCLHQAYGSGLSVHVVNMLIPIIHNVGRAHHGAILRTVASLVEDEHLEPLVDDLTFTFNEIGDAHDYAESGKQMGKVAVVHPDG